MLTLVEIIARNCEKSGVAQYDDRYPTIQDVPLEKLTWPCPAV